MLNDNVVTAFLRRAGANGPIGGTWRLTMILLTTSIGALGWFGQHTMESYSKQHEAIIAAATENNNKIIELTTMIRERVPERDKEIAQLTEGIALLRTGLEDIDRRVTRVEDAVHNARGAKP